MYPIDKTNMDLLRLLHFLAHKAGYDELTQSQMRIASGETLEDLGLTHVALRMTSWDQAGQLGRFLNEIAPAVA